MFSVEQIKSLQINVIMFYLKMAKRRRNNIVMVEKEKPKKVVLPNSRTFFAKRKRVRVDNVSANATIDRRYKRRRGGCQRCCVLKYSLSKYIALQKSCQQ